MLAVDLPSGTDADSGVASGRAVRADATVTFAALKPGLLQGDGPARSGRVQVADIGIGFPVPRALLVEDADAAIVPRRARAATSGTTPSVWPRARPAWRERPSCAPAVPWPQAQAWSAWGRRATLPPPGRPRPCACTSPPRAWAGPFLEAAAKCKAVVIGPGLGTEPETAEEIRAVVSGAPVPLVIDADALTVLGGVREARRLLEGRSAPAVLTPHDGEYARIAGEPPGGDRLDAARRLAGATGAVVLLKGPLTAVAAPVA